MKESKSLINIIKNPKIILLVILLLAIILKQPGNIKIPYHSNTIYFSSSGSIPSRKRNVQ